MKKLLVSAALMTGCAFALAKLPPMDDAAKAKAAEAAAKTGWSGKVDAYLTCKAQDKVAAHYRKTAGSAPAKAGASGVSAPAVAAPATAAISATASAPATRATPATATATATAPAAPASMVAAAPAVPGGTAPVVAGAPTPTPCADPGPFAYSAPEQKPLEASGAHSPAGNATSPPSVRTPSADLAPAKK